MAYIEAAMAAYGAASQYYKDKEEADFREEVLASLGRIENNTEAILQIAKQILKWTENSLKSQDIHHACKGIDQAKNRFKEILAGFGEGKETDREGEERLTEFQSNLANWCQTLREEAGFAAYPTVAVGVSLLMVLFKRGNLLAKGTFLAMLKPNFDYFNEALTVKKKDPQDRDNRPAYLYVRSTEMLAQYPGYFSLLQTKLTVGPRLLFITGTNMDSLETGGWYGSIEGNWNSELVLGAHEGYRLKIMGIQQPRIIQVMPSFIPDGGSMTLDPVHHDICYDCGGSAGRDQGYAAIGRLNTMIGDLNWAKSSNLDLADHCRNLQMIVSELEPIIGEQLAIVQADPALRDRYAAYLA